MTVSLNGTSQYFVMSGLTATTTYGLNITLGTGHLPNGFGPPVESIAQLVSTRASFDSAGYIRTLDAIYFNTGPTLQVDSGPVWNSGNQPQAATADAELSDNCVLKIRDVTIATNTLSSYGDGNQNVMHLFGEYTSGGGEKFLAANVNQIDLLEDGTDSVLATFDLTTPAASYTNSGITLEFVGYSATDSDPPVFDVGPTVTATSNSGHTISSTMDEDCTIYGVRLVDGAATPTAAQVKAGQDSTGSAAPEAQNAAALASASQDLVFTGGSISTPYKYCIVAEDGSGNLTSDVNVQVLSATTSAGTIAITGNSLTYGAAFNGTYSGIGSLSTPITLTDTGGNTLNVTIVDGGGGNFSGTMPSLPQSGSSNLLLIGNVTITGSP